MKIEANKFYWTRGKDLVYIHYVDQNTGAYGASGLLIHYEKSCTLTWTVEGLYNWSSAANLDLVEEVTDPVIFALYALYPIYDQLKK